MEKRTFLAVAVCVLIFLGWQRFYVKPYVDAQNAYRASMQQTLPQAATENGGSSVDSISNSAKVSQKLQNSKVATSSFQSVLPKDIILNQKAPRVVMTTKGAAVQSVDLEDYKGKNSDNFYALVAGPGAQGTLSAPQGDFSYLDDIVYSVAHEQQGVVHLIYEDAKIKIVRKFNYISDILVLDSSTEIAFLTDVRPAFIFNTISTKLDVGKLENEKRDVVLSKASGSQDYYTVSDVSERKEDAGDVAWVGLGSRYFLNALITKEGPSPKFMTEPLNQGQWAAARLAYPVTEQTLKFSSRHYLGPKDVLVLQKVDPRLAAAVDFGWFTFFAYPLLQGLNWLYSYVHNFGIAIILLTILVKIATYPLTYKSMKSMKDMQRIQPQIQKLRDKHGDNKEQLNKEMLTLMRGNGYNPLSGCLPILVQMPIFIALYNVLYNSIELYGQPFFGWISDLSQKDPYFVTPVLLAGVMFVQQKLTPNTTADPAQQKMMTFMPVIFGAMMLWLPSGLTLYMLVNSVVSIVQQMLINRSFARAGLT